MDLNALQDRKKSAFLVDLVERYDRLFLHVLLDISEQGSKNYPGFIKGKRLVVAR